MKTYPVSPIAGIEASITKLINHPIEKAIAKPAINIPSVISTDEFFSPRAPRYAKQSVAKLEESYDWLMTSNQPIYCLSSDCR